MISRTRGSLLSGNNSSGIMRLSKLIYQLIFGVLCCLGWVINREYQLKLTLQETIGNLRDAHAKTSILNKYPTNMLSK